jgi:type 1 glutamine amidotransferase
MLVVLAALFIQLLYLPQSQAAEATLKVLVVTGGHDYERAPFETMFRGFAGMECRFVEHPKAHDWFKPENAAKYDVVVLYDMWGNISDDAKKDFETLLKNGKGLVALHHCLAGYPKWDEYREIIGGQYHQDKWVQNGADMPASTYKHDVRFTVQIADPSHPVVKGLKDFDIQDETYGAFEVLPKSKPLLSTTEALDFAMLFLYVSDDLEYKETVRGGVGAAQAAGELGCARWLVCGGSHRPFPAPLPPPCHAPAVVAR